MRPAMLATWAKASAWGSRPFVRASPSTITSERGSSSSEISPGIRARPARSRCSRDVGDPSLARYAPRDAQKVALVLEDLGHFGDPLDETKLRSLRKESCSACRTDRKKTLAEVTEVERRRGRRSPRRGRSPVTKAQRHAPCLKARRASCGATSPPARAAPSLFVAERRPGAASSARRRDAPPQGPGRGCGQRVQLGERTEGEAPRCARSAPVPSSRAGGSKRLSCRGRSPIGRRPRRG